MTIRRRDILIFGAGGHGKVIIDIVEKQDKFHIIGMTDCKKKKGDVVYGYPIVGDINVLEQAEYAQINEGIVAIGDNWTREQLVSRISKIRPGFRFITAIHPSATIARGVEIGEGSVLMAGVIVNSDTFIGNHSIINTKSSVGHDCKISDYVTIGPGVTIGGEVRINTFTAISLGASIIHDIGVGANTVVGAGAVVVGNIGDGLVVCGVPAKMVRTRTYGEKYL